MISGNLYGVKWCSDSSSPTFAERLLMVRLDVSIQDDHLTYRALVFGRSEKDVRSAFTESGILGVTIEERP